MKKGYISKRIIATILCFGMLFSFTGCEEKEIKRYQTYMKSLIAINYLGATEDYIEATGANQEDAEALYNSNIDLLTNNLLAYYQVQTDHAPEIRDGFSDLAKNIYSKVNYKVDKARKDGSVYLVDVTVYPIMLFQQTSTDVTAYVNAFNDRVAAGDFNDYTVEDYQKEFGQGLLDILNAACITMEYGDAQVITVEIIEDGDKFYISDRDFLKIDNAMISAAVIMPTTEDTGEEAEEIAE